MRFRAFSAIMFGMTMLGFSLGLVLGVYLHTESHVWAYLAVPFMGLGSAVAAYGTLRTKKGREKLEAQDG